jgi:uncharacterized membrane protein
MKKSLIFLFLLTLVLFSCNNETSNQEKDDKNEQTKVEKSSTKTDYKKLDNKYVDYSPNYTNILKIWHELKNDSGFKEKYYYVDWNSFEFLNNSEHFLLLTSLFNILSPVIALLSIIFILIRLFKYNDLHISKGALGEFSVFRDVAF